MKLSAFLLLALLPFFQNAYAATPRIPLSAPYLNQTVVNDGLGTITEITEDLNLGWDFRTEGSRQIIGTQLEYVFGAYFDRANAAGLSDEKAANALLIAVEIFSKSDELDGSAKEFVLGLTRIQIAKYGVERDQ